MYNGTTLHAMGECSVKCNRENKTYDIRFIIVNKDVQPILGAPTCISAKFMQALVYDNVHHKSINLLENNAGMNARASLSQAKIVE